MIRNKFLFALGTALFVAGSASMVLGGGGRAPHNGRPGHNPHAVEVSLAPTPLAANAGLEDASGVGSVRVDDGVVVIVVDLHGATLPEGSVLEGWVVDPGTQGGPGGPGLTSVSGDDEIYGPPFGDPNLDMLADEGAYALSTGVLRRVGRTDIYQVTFRIENNLTPYNAVVVTLESDGNGENYDPRPGTPVLAGLY